MQLTPADFNITPKYHFITHYYDLMTYYGSLQKFSTARMERKNRTNKQLLRQSRNFKNTVYSLASLHQEWQVVMKYNRNYYIFLFNELNICYKIIKFNSILNYFKF